MWPSEQSSPTSPSDAGLTEKELRLLADAMPQLAWMARVDGSVAWFNRYWYAFTGATPQEPADAACRAAHHPEHVDRAAEGYHRAIALGEPWTDTFPLRGKDGRYRWFLTSAFPVRNESGAIKQWFGVSTDITAQFEGAEKLRKSEARFRALVEASPLGIAVMDMNGEPIFYNPMCEMLHGSSLEEARASGWTRALHPDDRQWVADSWRRARMMAKPWSETYRFLHPDGRVVWVSGRAAPMHVAGRQVGYVGTLEDITELKAAECERERLLELEREARCRAERATQQRGETLGIVAHDLRNYLHTLAILATRMLKAPTEAQAGPGSDLGIMRRTIESMGRLISDLLDVSTIEAGGLAIEPIRCDLGALLDEALESFMCAAAEKNITLICSPTQGLPAVLADRSRINQVLSNLLDNAMKFTPPGGSVRLETHLQEKYVHVTVADTGAGIPAENLAHIFDRFWQAHRAARAGAGLGLAIAKGLVEAHGGRIWAQSKPGSGTTMSFTIPTAPS
ncbi:MAG TPA: PAS domain-containing sensor histidine kinase [Steroidobacter sp.]|nr:PAS domain-containing sensor histidine kinase [Steroidobacter sp.]